MGPGFGYIPKNPETAFQHGTEGRSLRQDRFVYYMKQDAHYLADYGRALAIAGTRSGDTEIMKQFFDFANGAVVVERALHEHYLKEFGTGLDIPKSLHVRHTPDF